MIKCLRCKYCFNVTADHALGTGILSVISDCLMYIRCIYEIDSVHKHSCAQCYDCMRESIRKMSLCVQAASLLWSQMRQLC